MLVRIVDGAVIDGQAKTIVLSMCGAVGIHAIGTDAVIHSEVIMPLMVLLEMLSAFE
jgi:hypothetical protein